jgi:hypothetical protein
LRSVLLAISQISSTNVDPICCEICSFYNENHQLTKIIPFPVLFYRKLLLLLMMARLIFTIFFLAILILWLNIEKSDACKITIKLKSNTKEKFRIQVFVPSVKQKSEKVLFTGPDEKKLQVGYIGEEISLFGIVTD